MNRFESYRRERGADMSTRAAQALALVRHGEAVRALLCMVGDSYRTEDGLRVTVEADPDYVDLDDALGDCFGRFERGEPRSHDPDAVAADFYRSGWHYWRDGATAERVSWYRKQGMARGPAWLQARRDLVQEAETCHRLIEEGWFSVSVTVTDDDGDEIGFDSLGCVEAGWIENALVEYDLIDDALREARSVIDARRTEAARVAEAARPDLYTLA